MFKVSNIKKGRDMYRNPKAKRVKSKDLSVRRIKNGTSALVTEAALSEARNPNAISSVRQMLVSLKNDRPRLLSFIKYCSEKEIDVKPLLLSTGEYDLSDMEELEVQLREIEENVSEQDQSKDITNVEPNTKQTIVE
jgi:hypothetical protein